jgi:hypothetical protein
MYDFARFFPGDALRCAAELRELGQVAKSMEEVARRVADYFYTNFIDSRTGEPAAPGRPWQTRQCMCLNSVAAEVTFRHAEAAQRAFIVWGFVWVLQT